MLEARYGLMSRSQIDIDLDNRQAIIAAEVPSLLSTRKTPSVTQLMVSQDITMLYAVHSSAPIMAADSIDTWLMALKWRELTHESAECRGG